MENNNELLLNSQVQSLQRRVLELETENAHLSNRLCNCLCQKSGVLYPIEEVKSLKIDSHETLPDTSNSATAMHHLPKQYVALKVMYFGKRYTLMPNFYW